MAQRLGDRVTVILGADTVTGTAVARLFARVGSKVVLAASEPEPLQVLADAIHTAHGEALAVVTDPAVYPQVKNLVDRAVETFGRIDIMVNASGFGVLRPLAESSPQEIDDQIDVNIKGVCYGSKAVLQTMKRQRSGTILNFGSVACTKPFPNFSVYTATDHAVLGFSRSLHEEVRGHGIRVHVLCPDAVNEDTITLGGAAEVPWSVDDVVDADDIAEMALACVTAPANMKLESVVNLSRRTTEAR